jgi:anaerobic selenocysteine-containing dehydrogenase
LITYPPEVAAGICWIEADKIREAARLYAKARPGSIQLGLALDMQAAGLPAAQAVMDMQCITGNLDVPGGCIFCPDPFGVVWASTGLHQFVPEETRHRTMGHDRFPILKYGVTFPSPDAFIEQLETGKPYPLKVAFMQGNNFLTCMGQDPLRWQKAASNLDFFVAVDLFMTPTIQALADIVLPATTYAERNSFRAQFYNLSTVNAAIDCYEDTKTDLEIVLDLGKRLNPEAWDFDDEIAVIDMMLSPSKMGYEDIKQNKGWAYPAFTYKKYEKGLMRPDGQPGFMTPTGRVELFSNFFSNFGLNPLPNFAEPVVSPVKTPEIYEKYPIILMTGARNPVSFHSEHRQIQPLREISPDPLVEINPEDAKSLGVHDGDWVWIENQKDKIRQKACVTKMVQKGMALSYHAWWFPEIKDPKANFGMWEVNNNRLLEMGHVGPSGFGSDIKSTLVKIYKAETSPLQDFGMEG